MKAIPKSHPRYNSLMTRQKITDALEKGFVHKTGLIAHGRGEAFDYIFGEQTISLADDAEKAAAAVLLMAKKPVISVNGNVVALVPEECISLSISIPAKIEVNLFHRKDERFRLLVEELERYGVESIHGSKADSCIPGLDHNRGLCDSNGIFSADVVLVLLEDGDRCQALKKNG